MLENRFKFKLRLDRGATVYTAELNYDNTKEYIIAWVDEEGEIYFTTYNTKDVEENVKSGNWIILDKGKKDKFKFRVNNIDKIFMAERKNDRYNISWVEPEVTHSSEFLEEDVMYNIKANNWTILDE